MNKLSDEVLNKYIDGELDFSAMAEVNQIINSSVEDKIKLDALLSIHKELKDVKEVKVSSDFTSSVMRKLNRSVKFKKADKRFIAFISSIFIVIAVGILGYVIYLMIPQTQASDSINQNVNMYVNHFADMIVSFSNLVNSKNISIIGSVFSLGLLVSGYFFFESQRQSKRRMGKFN